MKTLVSVLLAGLTTIVCAADSAPNSGPKWTVGTPIVTYWAGPQMSDVVAKQMADGGFNLVWCGEKELDVAARHHLRAQLQDPLLSPASLENPEQRAKLDALVDRVRSHAALYAYFITDEPNSKDFAALGKLVAHLHDRDPAHLAYINLFPTYASNEQLGNAGDKVTAYKAHLDGYIQQVRPDLISYDHYQFSAKGDHPDYFLNLALIRNAAKSAGLPFLNIVQACTWTPSMRVPTSDEMMYLVYTTAAYGAKGISYYVYCCDGHTGGIANKDGTPTPLYSALGKLNREFVAISGELSKLDSVDVYHYGTLPPGAEALPVNAPISIDAPCKDPSFKSGEPVKGILIGLFGKSSKAPTHAVVVNLDYRNETVAKIRGPHSISVFDPGSSKWSKPKGKTVDLHLGHGEGQLVHW